jgi:hypothetical protein
LRPKLAVTDLSLSIVTVHVLFPEHAPLQPSKFELAAADATSVTLVPWANEAEQEEPQSIPPLSLVTVPDPVPVFETVSFRCPTENVAVTDLSLSMVTVHVPVPEHPAPLQPSKLEPAAGVAESVTLVPC